MWGKGQSAGIVGVITLDVITLEMCHRYPSVDAAVVPVRLDCDSWLVAGVAGESAHMDFPRSGFTHSLLCNQIIL